MERMEGAPPLERISRNTLLTTGVFVHEYEEHAAALTGYMMRLTGGRTAEADDLVQETFLRAWSSRRQFGGRSSIKTWLFSIAVNLFRESLRKGKKLHYTDQETEAACPRPTQRTYAIGMEMRERIAAAVASLPEELRECFELVRIQGMRYEEAAEILGLSVAAIRMRLHRAHLHLADALRDYGESI